MEIMPAWQGVFFDVTVTWSCLFMVMVMGMGMSIGMVVVAVTVLFIHGFSWCYFIVLMCIAGASFGTRCQVKIGS